MERATVTTVGRTERFWQEAPMTSKILRLSPTRKKDVRRSVARLLVALSLTATLTGCASLSDRLCQCDLREAMLACRSRCPTANIADARDAAFWASQHERAGSEQSVELYFLAAKMSYCEGAVGVSGESASELQVVYRESLAGLIRTAQQFGRYSPIDGIRVQGNGEAAIVPISYHGFNWGPRDFSRLVVADRFVRTELEANFYGEGVGLPLIVIREKETPERFHTPRSHFAATANLKCNGKSSADCAPTWTLELADPFSVDCVEFNGQTVRLAADYSAPTRYTVGREERTYLQDFLRPGVSTGEAKLMLLEPYQPGKIPIVFIHGLLSDPMTWADLFETIHVDRELRDRYQFWAFQYATGEAFLRSAAVLRQELAAVMTCVDPDGTDPALSQIVLIGHSMGGLLAELQITSSEDRLWRSFANRPMESLQTSPKLRARMQELFYFEPSPHIRRVVFIGTPHNGSVMANQWIGRIGSYLVRVPDADKQQYEAFLAANPGVVHEFAAKRIPTSVDMLEPNNPILTAMASLPKSPCVVTHSVIGTGGCSLACEPSDSVVPVASAHIPGVESEIFVDKKHEDLHRDPKTIQEVVRILRRHLQCMEADSRQ